MINKRNFLKFTAVTLATSLTSPALLARNLSPRERELQFYNLHTGEALKAKYWVDGDFVDSELSAINHLLRDHRSGDVAAIDRQLLHTLYELQQKVEKSGPFHVISGYRSPKTNSRLRQSGGGVAKRSLHMRGKAIDIRLPGVDLAQLRRAALKIRAGGVGYYPKSNFIHLDTGRQRFW